MKTGWRRVTSERMLIIFEVEHPRAIQVCDQQFNLLSLSVEKEA